MRSTITAIQMGIRVVWLVQLALGVLFWTGNATGLVDLHQLLGILLVLALWTQAVLAARPAWRPAWSPWPPSGACSCPSSGSPRPAC